MTNALKIAPPPRRPTSTAVSEAAAPTVAPVVTPSKFEQVKEDDRVQFNKRVTRRVADGFEMLAIRSRKKVPALLAEALDLLEERYGKVG
jgi:hypothetical protein